MMSILGNAIMVGGGSAPTPPTPTTAKWSDVNFIDYDGTLLYSYTASEFQALTSMPANPSHSGLTSQGWNWTLANAKTQVTSVGGCNIGQMYVTSDSKTRVYIHLEQDYLSPYCGFGVNGTVTIDWGDGSSVESVTGTSVSTVKNTQHTYASAGDYIITLTVSSGSIQLYGASSYGSYLLRRGTATSSTLNYVYQRAIKKVELGANCLISSYAFSGCYNLKSITLSSNISSMGYSTFAACYSLKSITIPINVTAVGATGFSDSGIISISLSENISSLGYSSFYKCYHLIYFYCPYKLTKISDDTFNSCYALPSITLPSDVTNIEFNAFVNCYALSSIAIPSSVTQIGYTAFDRCYNLSYVTIPSEVTQINSTTFRYCYSLSAITIPSKVASIAASAFSTCYGLSFIKFEPTAPPTVANSNAWSKLPTDCIIYVPRGYLSAYTGATNYPSSSTYTYVEY